MGRFTGMLLVSDMDATLLNSDGIITDNNRNAIEYFISEGGRFTVASGRMVPAVRAYFSQMTINAPAILHNGAKLYDYETESVFFEKFIEEHRKEYIRRVHDEAPQFGIEIYSNELVYVYNPCFETERFKTKPYDVFYTMPDEVWHKPWIKALIIGHREELDKYEPIYRTIDDGYCVRSGDKYLDIVATGVSKGIGVQRLAKLLKLDMKNVIAIGDNMNDIDMLKCAGIGCAVGNAEPDVKAAANIVVPDCDSDPIAYIINNIGDLVNE